ncbi:DUF1998 domain-containing protein [Blastococcus mobilis]|uniref:MrfA-like Zn-binding domain-containing protein n=1 Tax=Blastococcus mobilis TaxID=1938746 RepID=A0A238ZQY3_9ACTN|nr:DUF1998 domain-containing protein [Blastococcus mobilis]SNR85817.1 protein of unknown function [Blastococcus mobilis]
MTAARRDPTRIGNARPSQLMTTAGVGAVVDLPGMSVIVRGLDAWGAGGLPISEPRLLAQVQQALPGSGVTSLRAAPNDPQTADDPYTHVGVPVTTFPRWLRCPACYQLLPIDGVDQLELHHRYGRRPDLAKWVHRHCPRQSVAPAKRRACIPARFVVACNRGHLDEFPYVDFVHQAAQRPCPGPQLEMRDAGSVLGPRVTVSCTAGCGATRNISSAAGRAGAANLPRCRGRHPHLQTYGPCDQVLKLMVLGASNLWFGVSVSALHLPQDDPVAGTIAEHWDVLSVQPSEEVLAAVVAGMPALHALRELSTDELTAAIQAERDRRAQATDDQPLPGLLDAEWELFSHPTTTQHDDDFLAVPTPTPERYTGLLRQVVQVERLREVQAMVGFTRIDAPAQGDLQPTFRAPLSAGRVGWVPAVERRGEGIFLELRESEVVAWSAQVEDHPHVEALRSSYARWRSNRDLSPDPGFTIPRYLLIHTLSHLLLRQVALECGYSSASIRERLYVGTRDRPTAGVLLSTAASDSEGTLGGLVALADARFLGRLLDQALEDAQTCSSDPLCRERVPESPSDQLHAAACHACLFASETSCEAGNRWLHRGVLVDIADGLAIKL